MEILLVWFLVALFILWLAGGLLRRSRRGGSRWRRGPRAILILVVLFGAYLLVMLAVFLIQPVFNS
jgi:hypothetical protein